MRQMLLFLTCVAVAAMLGCGVPSLHPLVSDEKDIVFDPGLIGTWVKPGSQLSFTVEQGVVATTNTTGGITLNQGADKTYVITATDENGSVSKLAGYMTRLDSHLFFCTTADNPNIKGYEVFHLLPVYLFTKISFSRDTLTFATLNAKWVGELHEQNKLPPCHEAANGTILLTAGTPELREFIRANANNTNAFTEPTELKRKK